MTILAAIALLVGVASAPLAAQQVGWHAAAEASANTLFGATSQTLTSMTATVLHAGDGFNADATVKFRYGESEDEQRARFVSARAFAVAVSVDGMPNGRFSPFFSMDAETSLEKRIANRRSAGAGAKWMFAKTATASVSASVGVLAERTMPLADTAVAPVRLARWSWRVKMQKEVGERVDVSHVTLYGPVFDAPAEYTVTSTTIASYDLNKAVALTFTVTDNYDSQARSRGATTNNDGSLLFGIRGKF